MTIHDWIPIIAAVVVMLPFSAALGWSIYQVVVLKKDVNFLETLKQLQELYDAIQQILNELGVENVDQALNEIRLMKGTAPTPKQEDEAWLPPVEPVGKK